MSFFRRLFGGRKATEPPTNLFYQMYDDPFLEASKEGEFSTVKSSLLRGQDIEAREPRIVSA